MLVKLEEQFDAAIAQGVKALTRPIYVEDETERRNKYSEQIRDNYYARFVKPLDRAQNHVTDLIKLATGQAPEGSEAWHNIVEYFVKTDRHLSEDFTSDELPKVYAQLYKVIWLYAKHFGYLAYDIAE